MMGEEVFVGPNILFEISKWVIDDDCIGYTIDVQA